jgi:hypothetical protein
MKTTGILARVAVVVLLLGSNAHLLGAYPNKKHHPPKPDVGPVVPLAPAVDPNLKKFKELPLNAVFVYPSDKTHEWFPRVKISETQARSLVTPSNPVAAVSPVPQEIVVYLAKDKPFTH